MFYSKLHPDQILQFEQESTIQAYHAGDMILQQGDECHEMLYIVEGSVRTVLLTCHGDEFLVSIHGPGEFICEASYITNRSSILSIYAMDDVRLLRLSDHAYHALLAKYPEVSTTIMMCISQKLNMVVDRLERYATSGIPSRIASVLLLFAEKYGVPTSGGIRINHRMTDSELGVYIGAKRETVNRTLKKLRDDHLIQKDGEFLHILNMEKLKKLAEK